MDAFGPVITIIFFVVIVFCVFVAGWLTGYERCRRESMQALKVYYERRGIIEPPPIDAAFERRPKYMILHHFARRKKKKRAKLLL
jgi:hypothetical protein